MRVCAQLLILALANAFWTACGGGGGSGTDGGSQEDSGAGGQCQADIDCNDGLFCNGVEICAPANPSANEAGCVAATAGPCVSGQSCDDTADRCETQCAMGDDADGDGHASTDCGGDDCDDGDANRFPGNTEVCDTDNVDEDCNDSTFGERDMDGDGFTDSACCNGTTCGDDCDDDATMTHPGETEECDQIDNNCDGNVDEGFECALGETRPCSTSCGEAGEQTCTAACIYDRCTSQEICNDCDDDDDGAIDNGFPCARGRTEPCTTDCGTAGSTTCANDCSGFSACTSQTETCNYCDDNGVDGLSDEQSLGIVQSFNFGSGNTQYFGDANIFGLHNFSANSTGGEYLTSPVTLGYGRLVFHVEMEIIRDDFVGERGWAAVLFLEDQGSGMVGTASSMGVPTNREGYAVEWQWRDTLADYVFVRSLRLGGAGSTLDSTTSVEPDYPNDVAAGPQVVEVRLNPDIPGSATNEMRLDVFMEGTAFATYSCTGSGCPVQLKAGDDVRFGVTGAAGSASQNGNPNLVFGGNDTTVVQPNSCPPAAGT